ncbi:hypothetical protein KSP39_PZI018290 [Platanthera zijinensis]|uniref:Uncharacterized protein n=1 Tax=Platanthera zijinensis TaxID=2320716 RepID=A0AAP0B3M9_9ASPA
MSDAKLFSSVQGIACISLFSPLDYKHYSVASKSRYPLLLLRFPIVLKPYSMDKAPRHRCFSPPQKRDIHVLRRLHNAGKVGQSLIPQLHSTKIISRCWFYKEGNGILLARASSHAASYSHCIIYDSRTSSLFLSHNLFRFRLVDFFSLEASTCGLQRCSCSPEMFLFANFFITFLPTRGEGLHLAVGHRQPIIV